MRRHERDRVFALMADDARLFEDPPLPVRDVSDTILAIDYDALAAEVRVRSFVTAASPARPSRRAEPNGGCGDFGGRGEFADRPSTKGRGARPRTGPGRPARTRRRFAAVCLTAILALVCLGQGWWNGAEPVDSPPAGTAIATADAGPKSPRPLAIEDVRVGRRVLADNPEFDDDTPRLTVAPSDYRLRVLERATADGVCRVEQLMHVDEVSAEDEDGATVTLDLPEFGVTGEFRVAAVLPCPEIHAGNGRLVTATFRHESKSVLDLRLDGQSEPLGVTAGHPFWSLDRSDWVAAGDLRVGERLLSLDGDAARVTALSRRTGTHTVYNLEVEGEHVYHVGPDGLLVHNTCRAIALGLDPHYKYLAELIAASHWRNWARDGVTRRSVSRFGRAFHHATQRTSRIHFSLDGINDPLQFALDGRAGFIRDSSGNAFRWTAAELYTILRTPDLLKKTTFYRNGIALSTGQLP